MKIVVTLLAMLAAGAGVVGYKWHAYVTNTTSPYDEIGIDLNAAAPGPINAWGCARLKENFGRQLPPHGCQTADFKWK